MLVPLAKILLSPSLRPNDGLFISTTLKLIPQSIVSSRERLFFCAFRAFPGTERKQASGFLLTKPTVAVLLFSGRLNLRIAGRGCILKIEKYRDFTPIELASRPAFPLTVPYQVMILAPGYPVSGRAIPQGCGCSSRTDVSTTGRMTMLNSSPLEKCCRGR